MQHLPTIQLPVQAWITEEWLTGAPASQPLQKLRPGPQNVDMKPDPALWTSTFDPEIGSDWLQWCLGNMPQWALKDNGQHADLWLLEVSPQAHICDLNTPEAANLFAAWYGEPLFTSDQLQSVGQPYSSRLIGERFNVRWAEVARDWQGVRWSGDFSAWDSGAIFLSSWDVESTVFFENVFDSIECYSSTELYKERLRNGG